MSTTLLACGTCHALFTTEADLREHQQGEPALLDLLDTVQAGLGCTPYMDGGRINEAQDALGPLREGLERLAEPHDGEPWLAVAALWTEHDCAADADEAELPLSSELSVLRPGMTTLLPCSVGPSVWRLRAVGLYSELRPLAERLAELGGDWSALEAELAAQAPQDTAEHPGEPVGPVALQETTPSTQVDP